MRAVVFCGPSLPAQDKDRFAGIEFLPPVKQGDVYKAAQRNPAAIGIIDGYFDGMPAVWHKEILWAICQGITVFGAASMGALRAAEMEAFGMRGIGRIFEDYRSGRLEDDDEVALVHGPAEIGYPALSEPMVNVRATVDHAQDDKIVSAEEAETIKARAKAIFYKDRNWAVIIDDLPFDAAKKDRISQWLVTEKIDLKQEDALEMLSEIERFLSSGEVPEQPDLYFENTETWVNASWLTEPPEPPEEIKAILESLAKDEKLAQSMRDKALLSLLAEIEADRIGLKPSNAATLEEENAFRERNELFSGQLLDEWAERNEIDRNALRRMMAGKANIRQLISEYEPELGAKIVDQLRLDGSYEKFKSDSD